MWSHKMKFLDILTTSPHYFYSKCVGTANEDLNFIFGFKGLNHSGEMQTESYHIMKRTYYLT